MARVRTCNALARCVVKSDDGILHSLFLPVATRRGAADPRRSEEIFPRQLCEGQGREEKERSRTGTMGKKVWLGVDGMMAVSPAGGRGLQLPPQRACRTLLMWAQN